MGSASTTQMRTKLSPFLGSVALVDALRNSVDIDGTKGVPVYQYGTSTTTNANRVEVINGAAVMTVSTTSGAAAMTIKDNGGDAASVTGGSLHTIDTEKLDSPYRGWVTATTAGTFELIPDTFDTYVNVHAVKVTSNVTTRVQFAMGATTVSPHFNISASAPVDFWLTDNTGSPWFKSATTASAFNLLLTAGEAGIGTGALINAYALGTTTSS